MHMIKLIIIFILSPIYAYANSNSEDLNISNLFSNSFSILNKAWHYKIISMDNQQITVANIIIALICLVIGLKIAKYSSVAFKKKLINLISLDQNYAHLIGRIVDYSFMMIIIVIVLDVAGVPLTIFTFIGGAVVISIGLSTQHLINNFFSGISLIIENKIKVGDLIEFDNIIGRVQSIEARMIQIKTQSNIEVFIPHSKLMQETFKHWTHHNGKLRLSTEFTIDQQDSINHDIEEIILNAITNNRYLFTTPVPQILLLSFEHNIVRYEVNFWVNVNDIDRRQIVSEINNYILNTLKSHNISLATPSLRYIEKDLNY